MLEQRTKQKENK